MGRCVGCLRDDLDEVATGVVEDCDDGGADVGRWLRDHDAQAGQSKVLGRDVVDGATPWKVSLRWRCRTTPARSTSATPTS